MRLWNIGAEGQFFMGAWGASAVVLLPLISAETSRWVAIPLMMVAGMAAGALWGFIPGILKARYSVNEIISTLMLNYIAIAWNDFFIFGVWSEGGFQQSATFPRNAWLPRLTDYARQVRGFSGLTTAPGPAVRADRDGGGLADSEPQPLGLRDPADRRQQARGRVRRGADQAPDRAGDDALGRAGRPGRHVGDQRRGASPARAISPGYGFTGIIVAWLAKLNPFAVILVAILFGALILAGREIQPSGIPKLIQGIVLMCLIASDFLLRYRVRLPRRVTSDVIRVTSTFKRHSSTRSSVKGSDMDPIIVLQAGVASGTVLLFATLGEIFSERAGVLNLGVEGMMLFGAMSAFGVAIATGNPWLAILVAMLAAGLLSQLHAFIVITLQSDQVVSGLALTFVGTGLSLVLGEGLSKAGAGALMPVASIPLLACDPAARPDLLRQPERAGVPGLPAGAAGLVLHLPHPRRHELARDRRIPRRRRRAGRQYLSPALLLCVCRRDAGRAGRRDNQPGRSRRAGSAS